MRFEIKNMVFFIVLITLFSQYILLGKGQVVLEDDIMFDEKHDILTQGYLQMSSLTMKKVKAEQSDLRMYDIDNLISKMGQDDLINIAKASVVFSDVDCSFFKVSSILSNSKYIKSTFADGKFKVLGPSSLKAEKNYWIKKITSNIHFSEYDFDKDEGLNMEREDADIYSTYISVNLPLKLITSTKSEEKDISFGSKGARTLNYYYAFNEKDILQVSIKILTLKKEELYNTVTYKGLGIWGQIKKNSSRAQIDGTLVATGQVKSLIMKSKI
ncbi:MAG: hypothetical protein CMP11_00660 [Zetaproteobacteria bacterium]|nr:hypothetical protein [Pseudobdellovibrionaceae bacterium]|tara:strand:+ start:1999 stop:2811 length:813 start_codon:yes stop_codon:yes gene_type:complete